MLHLSKTFRFFPVSFVGCKIVDENASDDLAWEGFYFCHSFLIIRDKHADHRHTKPVDNFNGAACQSCNTHCFKYSIPCLAHNSAGFDTHLVMQAIAKDNKYVRKVKRIVAKSVESYLTYEIHWRCDDCIERLEADGFEAMNRLGEGLDDDDDDDVDPGEKSETCECFRYSPFQFLDSCRMLPSSLSSLCESLKGQMKPFRCSECDALGKESSTADETVDGGDGGVGNPSLECGSCRTKKSADLVFPHTFSLISTRYGSEFLEICLRKQPYCYSYVDSWSKLKETRLPSREDFYNELLEEPCSEEDYEHVRELWSSLSLQNLEEFAELYLSLDVAILGLSY